MNYNLLNNILDVIKAPVKFFSFIGSNWLGLVIGLAVAVGIALIMLIVTKQMPNAVICILLAIICGVAGLYIANSQRVDDNEKPFVPPTTEEKIETIVKGVKANWKNTNGGFNPDEIKNTKSDDNCPTLNDIVLDFGLYEFDKYVCFQYLENDFLYNSVFIKTDSGLVYVGVLDTMCGFTKNDSNFWNSLFNNCHFDLESFTMVANENIEELYGKDYYDAKFSRIFSEFWNKGEEKYFEKMPTNYAEYLNAVKTVSGKSYPYMSKILPKYEKWYAHYKGAGSESAMNFVNIIDDNFTYCWNKYYLVDNKHTYKNINSAKNVILYKTNNFITNNTQYFNHFMGTELIGNVDTSSIVLNSFFNHIYNTYKETKGVVDVSDLACVVIPEDIRVNYPIPASKKAEYDNKDYYGVYNVNIGVNIAGYIQDPVKTNFNNEKEQDYQNKTNEDDTIKPTNYEKQEKQLSKLFVTLKAKNNSNELTNDLLAENPITITFTNRDTNKDTSLKIDNVYILNNSSSLILENNAIYDYEISSNLVQFDNYRGFFSIETTKAEIEFEYNYTLGYVVLKVGLNPRTNIDLSSINLSKYPVKIILSNDIHTYVFNFDDNSKIDSILTDIVELGTYDYTILSEQLIFTKTNDTIVVTNTNCYHLFDFGIKEDASNLTFEISVEKKQSSENKLKLYAPESTAQMVEKYLDKDSNYLVLITFYEDSGLIREQFKHTHQGGECVDNFYITDLVNNKEYTVQVRFVNSKNTSLSYISDTFKMVYEKGYNYTFTYSATENASN